MGPEAMGVANANLVWSDEKVCRNFLCGTCPHTLFTNTVSIDISYPVRPPSDELTENGPWSMSEITHRTTEDRVLASTRSQPYRPSIQQIPDGIRSEHLQVRRRV